MDPHLFSFLHHYYSPQKNHISATTRHLMPAFHHHGCRCHRCSHSHVVDTGAVTVTLLLRLLGSVLIVILAVVDYWHRSFFISTFSCLVVVLVAGTLFSISHHVPCVQLIVLLSAGAPFSVSHYALPLMASLSCLCPPCLYLLLCFSCSLAYASCYASTSHRPSPSVDCHVVVHWPLSLRSLNGYHLSFPLMADCYVTNTALLPLVGDKKMLHWLALWRFPPSMLSSSSTSLLLLLFWRTTLWRGLQWPSHQPPLLLSLPGCHREEHTPPLLLRALTSLKFLLWTSEPVTTSARDDNHS